MQFVMIKDYSWDLSKDKVILGTIENGKRTITLAYLIVIADFDKDCEYNIIFNTESVQIRPKAIYKNNKGYYIKSDNKRIYLNSKDTQEVEKAIEKFKRYLLKEG